MADTEWTFTYEDGRWTAHDPKDFDVVEVYVYEGALCVCDNRYYPSGGYSVPWSVADKLRELSKEAEALRPARVPT